jgi:vacuolar-type H+-ATPase subunit D/Vma8
MQEQGFKFVKPCDFFLESAAKKKNRQVVGSMGIEHMKFDNTKLLKAIKLMNDARKEQSGGKGKINLETLINNPKYQEAIDCLNDQFNARLNIRFIKKKEIGNTEFTTIYNDIKTHLTISKSKGFQLGGLPIDIFVTNTALDEDAPDDISLFGQHVISVFCHEIFHNIMAVLKSKEAQFTATLIETMTLARDIPSASNRRKLITNFVNMTDEFGDMKMNVITKRAMVKHLTYLSTIAHDEQAVREYEKAIKSKKVEGIDEEIRRMEKKIRKIKINTYGPTRYIIPAILTVATFSWVSSTAGTGLFPVACMAFGSAVGNLFGQGIVQAVEIDTIKKFKNGTIKNYEEHWCDMFAACYNLPVTFFMVGKPRTGAANDYALETLKRYDELERESRQLMLIKYPTISERNQAAVKYAKKTLDSKAKLDPAIKKYLEWIVSNYSKTLDMDIDEIYSKGTFDPKTAEDLDGHIEKLIGSANINVTESDLSWLSDIGDAEYL